MKVAMGPPPPKNPNPSNSNPISSIENQIETSNPATMKVSMGPPPPKFTNPSKTDSNLDEETHNRITEEIESNLSNTHVEEESKQEQLPEDSIPKPKPSSDSIPQEFLKVTVPYTIPPWSEAPCHPFFLEVLKDGLIIDQFDVSKKGAYMFGRVDLCDFVLEHPTISRFHAVMQFKESGEAYIYDLGSTHGTSINKNQVKKKVYTELHVGDVIRFGNSSRLYVFQGPSELMPPEGDLKKIRSAKIREDVQDREASLLRAKQEASLANGISWGMTEDAIEEAEEDTEEVTWQTYKGQLTERQQKTREKIIKRTEKIGNMKKEIDAIRVKDISQGGLTQGQQTQIARNEQRIAQILEELESLEETLNESIQESVGARGGKVRGKTKGAIEEEEDAPSDDDEFYDRTKKPATRKAGENPSVETADSLLDKRDDIMKEMEKKKILILNEKTRMTSETEGGTEAGDPLDAFMTGLSSQLVLDSTMHLQKDLSSLQSELDRILYLLKIADPSGEAAKKRELKVKASESNQADIPTSGLNEVFPKKQKKKSGSGKPTDESTHQEATPEGTTPETKVPEVDKSDTDSTESKAPLYAIPKPQWLGATHDIEMKETPQQETLDMHDAAQFVDYKDRKKSLGSVDNAQVETGIEAAAPGLIIRKRKQVDRLGESDDQTSELSTSSSAEAETTAEDAVALLLKHKRGYVISDEEHNNSPGVGVQSRNDNTNSRRVLGPEKPAFLKSNPDYEAWVPPEGQLGDGRTSLNDRLGY